MEFTATILRYIHQTIFMWLLATLIIQPASPFGADVVCENHPKFPMTDHQVEMCKTRSSLIPVLFENAVDVFKRQLHHHFKHERWDGKDIDPPIFGSTDKILTLKTKESAFVYALASAAVIHTVAENCVKNHKHLPYCGCDKSLNNNDLPEGERWAGCSPDMKFSVNFTKEFLDRRVDNESLQLKTFVLHNNNIGRLTVLEYMHKTCVCTGSGSSLCSRDKTCRMELPKMAEVAEKLRKHYDNAVHSKIHHSSGHSHPVVVHAHNEHKVNPEKMIHFSRSPDYCKANSEYKIYGVAGRDCIVNDTKTSSSHHCNNLCCDHGHEPYTEKVVKPCNCKFVWCCQVECETCHETITKYRCKSKQ